MSCRSTLQILIGGYTEHLTHLVTGGVDTVLLHLQLHQFARQHHFTYVIARIGFHHYLHAFFQRQVRAVMEIALACILELYLDQVRQLCILRQITQPVAHRQHMCRVALGCRSTELLMRISYGIFIHIFGFLINTIIWRHKSKKTIFALPFCSI